MSSQTQPSFNAPDRGENVFDDGYLRVEYDNYYVSCGGTEVVLARKAFLITSLLTRHYGKFVPPEEIWRHAWGEGEPFNSNTFRVNMHRLRRQMLPFNLLVRNRPNSGYSIQLVSNNEFSRNINGRTTRR